MTSQDRMKLGFFEQPWLRRGFLVVLTGVLVGCAQGNIGRAPVESRSLPRGSAAPLADGQYRVQPGDTLVRIAAMYNQNWRDLATWNQLSDPDSLEVGQILRLSAPRSGSGVAAKPAPAPTP
ncbi:MAG: LysM peptidoglycan-binding domain-containing protein, partial [Burkholderiaceae bacterium]|nr:LysM peptidoglycan-binding domain-containing protein [Burkholderiaceae bacterium]